MRITFLISMLLLSIFAQAQIFAFEVSKFNPTGDFMSKEYYNSRAGYAVSGLDAGITYEWTWDDNFGLSMGIKYGKCEFDNTAYARNLEKSIEEVFDGVYVRTEMNPLKFFTFTIGPAFRKRSNNILFRCYATTGLFSLNKGDEESFVRFREGYKEYTTYIRFKDGKGKSIGFNTGGAFGYYVEENFLITLGFNYMSTQTKIKYNSNGNSDNIDMPFSGFDLSLGILFDLY
jgi:hypothetical protein